MSTREITWCDACDSQLNVQRTNEIGLTGELLGAVTTDDGTMRSGNIDLCRPCTLLAVETLMRRNA